MNVLFDQGTPVPLRRWLHPHVIDTCAERGWSVLQNGDLLRHAEAEGYDAFITTDQNLRYQQNLANRTIRILVLKTTSRPRIQQRVEAVREALESVEGSGYIEIDA